MINYETVEKTPVCNMLFGFLLLEKASLAVYSNVIRELHNDS